MTKVSAEKKMGNFDQFYREEETPMYKCGVKSKKQQALA
jgi:hypothetical protein